MSNNSIYTRKVKGLDKRVWWVMFAAIILPLGLLSYRVINKKECSPVDFTFRSLSADAGNEFIQGETVSFKAASGEGMITWDFGDMSEKTTGQYVAHKFLNEGSYFIKVTTGAGCENIKKIVILKKPVDSSVGTIRIPTGNEIVGSTLTVAGKEEYFRTGETAGFYEWSVSNFPDMNQVGQVVKYTFPAKGIYVVQLTLDHDRNKRYTKEISVEDAPVLPAPSTGEGTVLVDSPSATPTIFIADVVFTGFMTEVVSGKKFVQNFDAYLCSTGSTLVVMNGKTSHKVKGQPDQPNNFEWACNYLNGKKVREKIAWKRAVEITGTKLTRDSEGCVTLIEINWK